MIEEAQRQLEDTIKGLNIKMREEMMALRSKVNKLAIIVKVIMMALEKSLLHGSALKHKGEMKVPKPRPNAREKIAQKIEEFISNMEQDVATSYIEDVTFVSR